jgi:hypothetical protein
LAALAFAHSMRYRSGLMTEERTMTIEVILAWFVLLSGPYWFFGVIFEKNASPTWIIFAVLMGIGTFIIGAILYGTGQVSQPAWLLGGVVVGFVAAYIVRPVARWNGRNTQAAQTNGPPPAPAKNLSNMPDQTRPPPRDAVGRILARNLNVPIEIDYQDADGHRSRRKVAVHYVTGWVREGPMYFSGWCHLRQAPRSFAFDRIHEIVDLRTGEVVTDPVTWLHEATGVHAQRFFFGLPEH